MAELKDAVEEVSQNVQTSTSSESAKDSPEATPPPSESPGEEGDDQEFETPYLKEVRDLFRQIVVTEENLGLYPAQSKVVKDSIAKLFTVATDCLEKAGTLRLQLGPEHIVYEDEAVYSEPERAKSLAFRIYKDGVREISIIPDATLEELTSFVTCLKESRKVDDDEDDFITLFWEKDCTHIQMQLADDYLSTEDLPDVPQSGEAVSGVIIQRFKVPNDEKERLQDALEKRQADDQGDATFEISEEEAAGIREMVQNEEAYFPLFDFVDILLEVMIRNPDPESFSKSVKMLRTIISALIEDLDFERAAHLMNKLSAEAHPGLTESHRRQLRDMLETFTDKQTFTVLETFLSENDKLAVNHPVFMLMKAFPRAAVETLCSFLRFPKHAQAVSNVLIDIGTGAAGSLAKYLSDPDPLIVRAMIGVLLETDGEQSVNHIAKALKHPDESVRIHGAKTILEKGDASVAPLFIPLLSENSKQLLNLALLCFGKFSCPEAYDHFCALIKNRSFNILDQKRQVHCFKALLKASYSKGIEFIKGTVLKWTFCLTQSSRDKKGAALTALGAFESKATRETLEKFAAKEKSPLAQVARRALKELEARKEQAEKSQPPKKTAEVQSV